MKTLLAASGTTLALLAAPSWAMPGSIAQLDWSSLAVTAPSGLTWDAPQTWVRGFVDPDGGTDAVADWSSTLSHQALGSGVGATGSANANSLTAEITGAWSGGSLASVYAAQGNTWRTANFSLAPGQSLQVSVAYHLSEDTTGLPTSQQYATTAYLWLWDGMGVFNNTADVDLASSPADGVLSVQWTNTGNTPYQGQLLAGAANYLYVTAVPEPAAGVLLAAGLLALAWQRRRRP